MLSGGTLSGRLGENVVCAAKTDVPSGQYRGQGGSSEGAPWPRGGSSMRRGGEHRLREHRHQGGSTDAPRGGRIAAQGGSTAEGAPRPRGEAPMCRGGEHRGITGGGGGGECGRRWKRCEGWRVNDQDHEGSGSGGGGEQGGVLFPPPHQPTKKP